MNKINELFYLGQEVECLVHGNGKIVDVFAIKSEFPIQAHFEKGGICMYSHEGKVSPSAQRTLYPKGSFKVLPNAGFDPDEEFRMGQDVICVVHGNGKVVHIFKEKAAAFPVQVLFENGSVCSYSHTGKMSISANRTLYSKGSIKVVITDMA